MFPRVEVDKLSICRGARTRTVRRTRWLAGCLACGSYEVIDLLRPIIRQTAA